MLVDDVEFEYRRDVVREESPNPDRPRRMPRRGDFVAVDLVGGRVVSVTLIVDTTPPPRDLIVYPGFPKVLPCVGCGRSMKTRSPSVRKCDACRARWADASVAAIPGIEQADAWP